MADKPLMNIDDAETMEFGNGARFEARLGPIAPHIGARRLGYNVTRLQPGKTAFPYHFHHGNEEMFVILEGSGRLRQNGQEYPLRRGDVIACPPGPESAHQITNDSDAELVYLAISTVDSPEVVEYPDSNKYGASVGRMPNIQFRVLGRRGETLDYWDGEE